MLRLNRWNVWRFWTVKRNMKKHSFWYYNAENEGIQRWKWRRYSSGIACHCVGRSNPWPNLQTKRIFECLRLGMAVTLTVKQEYELKAYLNTVIRKIFGFHKSESVKCCSWGGGRLDLDFIYVYLRHKKIFSATYFGFSLRSISSVTMVYIYFLKIGFSPTLTFAELFHCTFLSWLLIIIVL